MLSYNDVKKIFPSLIGRLKREGLKIIDIHEVKFPSLIGRLKRGSCDQDQVYRVGDFHPL